MKNKHQGSSMEDFLKEEGVLEEVQAKAIKKVISYALKKAMEEMQLSKSAMATKMHTSRSALDRLLDPDNMSVTLSSLIKACSVLGKRIQISVEDRAHHARHA